jgi:Membrane MotB of proton-channel complex MotA/MotB
MDEERSPTPPPLQDLSFYLLLLAFFILLTNLSVVHTAKLKSVTESLNSTFSASGRPVSTPVTLDSLSGEALGVVAALQEIGGIVRTEIALASVEIKSPGGPLEAKIPLDELFIGASPEIRPDRRSLIRIIASRLKNAPVGVRYDVELLVAGGWVTRQSLAEGEPLAVGRAGRLAQAFADEGLTGGRVAGGLMQRDGKHVRLIIHARPIDEVPSSRAPLPAQGR